MPKFNDFQTLLTAAEAYYFLGYAVIPLLGDFDPSRPKVAARAWSVYQQRLATVSEFADWFSPEGGAAALGIVTGRISRLVVLDFDSPDLFADFRLRFPDLLETRTVQSAGRGLPHLYFHLPTHLHVASQKRQGIDLLSDGRYVVAPPSVIHEQAYRITRGGMPRTLNERDIQRIQSFMSHIPSQAAPSLYKEETLPSSSVGTRHVVSVSPSLVYGLSANELAKVTDEGPGRGLSSPPPSHNPSKRELPSRAALHGLYFYWCKQGGRNDALFRTAIYARDHGLDETQTRRILVSLHVSTPFSTAKSPLSSVKPPLSTQWRGAGGEEKSAESQSDRQRETYATIRSAFSRPPRQNVPTPSPACGGGLGRGLPNAIREALLQRKLTYVVRILEGLLKAGFRAGKSFTVEQALQALKGIVGRDSVYNALNALAPNGQPYFRQRSPSALPPASKEAATQKQPLKTKKCFFVTEKKSGIKKRGPKQRRFRFPSINDLCRLLGVKVTGSDPITREDLTSARQTRMALHRELIKRRPAEYTRRWIAKRLGVSRRTINTYNKLMPVRTQATYTETTLSWANINTLLSDEVLAGAHIETILGKKYPALRSIACNLLGKGTFIRLKQRKGNLYWYGTDEPPPNITPQSHESLGTRHTATAPLASHSVGTRHAVSATPLSNESAAGNADATPSLVYGLSANEPAKVADEGSGWGLPSVGTRHNMSSTPLSTQWRGVGGEDALLPTVGEGLRPSRALSASSTLPHSNALERGLGGEVLSSPALPPEQAETLAQTIYERVNQSADGTSKHFSLKNARKLVRTYTEKDIQFALQRLKQRGNLANPTGFFVTVLRSTARMNEFLE